MSEPTRPSPRQGDTSSISPLYWQDDQLMMLDQTRLPTQEVWLHCQKPQEVADAIRRLSVRGAPGIGVAAAYGLVLGLDPSQDRKQAAGKFDETFSLLASTRPTAVNLRWALDQGRRVFEAHLPDGPQAARQALLDWANELHRQDVEINQRIGDWGKELFSRGDRVLTHCNAGALATAGYGTALGVIRSSWDNGRVDLVWVDETRPLLQGARLTAWELRKLQIPHRLITDSSAGSIMAQGLVDRVVVGADRIAANGDVANKIGTYSVAVLAQRHHVPFYVAAPLSTIDPNTPTGAEIPIEEREPSEVIEVFGATVAPRETPVLNLAFDVTPNELVSAIITEVGVLEPPFSESIARALSS